MKALKITGIVIGSVLVLVLIVVAVGWILLSRPSKIAASVTSVPSDAQAAQSLDTKWNNFDSTIAQSSAGTPVTVTLTQEEVNSKVNAELTTVDLPDGLTVSNVNVNLKDGQILLSADLKYSIFSGSAGMTATVQIVNGQPTVVVTDVDMGSLPIPQSMKDQLTGLISGASLFQESTAAFVTQSVQIADSKIIISGITK
jgi:hypothetical protein